MAKQSGNYSRAAGVDSGFLKAKEIIIEKKRVGEAELNELKISVSKKFRQFLLAKFNRKDEISKSADVLHPDALIASWGLDKIIEEQAILLLDEIICSDGIYQKNPEGSYKLINKEKILEKYAPVVLKQKVLVIFKKSSRAELSVKDILSELQKIDSFISESNVRVAIEKLITDKLVVLSKPVNRGKKHLQKAEQYKLIENIHIKT